MASPTVRFRVDEVGAWRYVRFVETEKDISPGSGEAAGRIIFALDGAKYSSSKIEFINPRPAVVVDRKNA